MTNDQSDYHERAMFQLVGQMVSMAAYLEMRLQMLATQLVETPYAAHWINGENSSRVIKLIGDIAKERPDVSSARRSELQMILGECTRLFTRRHGYVHGAWSIDAAAPDERGSWQTMRFTRGKHTPTFAPLSPEDLADLIRGFDEALSKVMTWMVDQIKLQSGVPIQDAEDGSNISEAKHD
ncbi:hypothetical protein [Streptomyces griseorubiginosus]|nr:hypothetical protein [Streptomyces griseorubiginosus]